MKLVRSQPGPSTHKWRSSPWLISGSIIVALFSETFLYSFLGPIVSYILERRLHLDPAQTQTFTSGLLSLHGLCSSVAVPVITHYADRTSFRKSWLLILALVGSIAGTLLVALAPSSWVLYLGRALQAIAGAGSSATGLAILTERFAQHETIMGFASTALSAGTRSGPFISGTIMQLAGYWAMWSIPLTILVLDIVARLIVIEPHEEEEEPHTSSESATPVLRPRNDVDESTLLLPNPRLSRRHDSLSGFYRLMLSDERVRTGLASMVMDSTLIAGMINTLPAHLREIFGWGSLPTGLMFLCLQAPSVVLGVPFEWLRDRYGPKIPTTIGFIAGGPLLLFLGIPGNDHFPWAGKNAAGKPIFVACMIGFGISSIFTRGAGPAQLRSVANDLQRDKPHIVGNGRSGSVSSMVLVASSIGMLLGPLLSGALSETVGFSTMNLIFSATSIAMAVPSFLCLDGKPPSENLDQAPSSDSVYSYSSLDSHA
ncbi:MFS general substrate transporter [Penicillium taxi]|uniref:MFS general substrate transporter n=1 Tax=Penicillium taxi TaxID=168475 RepID=UPI0025456721|nr:MFS general substrate transporter [Penicillium taxi]KAJ5893815.1 MFS general substrate transporter [Penicillium taxi]